MVEHALLMGLLLLGVALLLALFASPVFSRAFQPFNDRGAAPLPALPRFGAMAAGQAGSRAPVVPLTGGRKRGRTLQRRAAVAKPRTADIVVLLTAEQRATLEQRAVRRVGPALTVLRARALLMAADGASRADIARQLGVSEERVREWLWSAVVWPVECTAGSDRRTCRGRVVLPPDEDRRAEGDPADLAATGRPG